MSPYLSSLRASWSDVSYRVFVSQSSSRMAPSAGFKCLQAVPVSLTVHVLINRAPEFCSSRSQVCRKAEQASVGAVAEGEYVHITSASFMLTCPMCAVEKSAFEGEPTQASASVAAHGDMVFENAILFMRDALLLRLLTDVIKCGDSGRLTLILKPLALFYRGTGRSNYAQELLYLIHNLTNVWPEPLRYVCYPYLP